MRRHLNQYVFSPLFWLMSLLLMTLLILVMLLFTPFGPKIIANVADSALEELNLKGVSGSFLTGLKVEEFAWQSSVGVVLKDIKINVDQYDIDKKKLVADKLSVGELAIILPQDEQQTETSDVPIEIPDFGLPVNINTKELKLDSLQIVREIPDQEGRTLLFQIKGIVLKDAVINDGQLSFAQLQGSPTILDQPLNIKVGNGSLNMNQPHEVKTSGQVSFKHPDLGDLTGTIELGGTLTEYTFESESVFEQEKIGKGSLILNGEGNYKNINFNLVDIASPHGNAKSTKAQIVWDPEIRLAFDIDAKQLTTQKLLPDWPLTADATLKYSASYIDSRLENQVTIESLEGKFRGQPLTSNGRITEREGLIRAENLNIELGDNSFTVTGAVTEPLNLAVTFNAKKFVQIYPDLSGSMKGIASIKGEYAAPQIISKLSAKNLSYGEFKQGKDTLFLTTDVGLENGELQINNILAKLGNNQLKLSGKATEPFKLKWELDAQNLKQITPIVSGRVKGSGVLTGTTKQAASSVDLSVNNFAYKEFKQGQDTLFLKGEVASNEKIIQLKSMLAKSGTNTIEVTGTASDPTNLAIKINAQNLSEVSPDLTGRITGTATIKGSYESPTIISNVVGSQLAFKQNRLSNAEVKLQGEMQIQNGVPIVKQLNSQIGNNNIQLSGKASSPFDLTWNIDGKNLKQILPDLSGSLVAKGKLQGTIDKPIINTNGVAKNLNYKEFSLSSGNFIASTKSGIYRIEGNIKKLKNSEQTVDSAKVELNGTIENHQIKATVDHAEAKVNLSANGGWNGKRWQGVVKNLKLTETKAGDWRLQKPTRVSLSEDGFSADKLCFASAKTQACSVASYSKSSGLTAKGTIKKTPLELLKPFLPEGLTLNGDVEGSYDIQQNNGKPKGIIKFKLPSSSFSFKGEDGEEQIFSYENTELTANINDRIISTEAKMKVLKRGVFSSKAKIKLSPKNGKHTIEGTANFDVPNIHFAQRFIPHSRGLRGAWNSKFTFSGLLTKPQIKVKAQLKNGYLRLPEAGTQITNINLNLSADKPGLAAIKGKMLMGKGVLNVSGDLNLRDVTKWKANVKITGKNIRFMNTNEIKAIMSPDILLSLTPELVNITGKIEIPEADIRLKALPESSIDESTDTIVIGESSSGEKVTSVKVRPKVLVTLGKKVRMNAFGLQAKLSGDVQINHNRRDILANGSLRVQDGKFQAYGQDLAINNGRLIFNGSPRLVGMDIRATRTIDKQIVGVHLGGTLLNPKSKIFSEPALEESESLSYLLTGHSLSTASGQESALLLSAVRGLGVTGSGSIVQKIGSSFGLDDVNIVTKDDLKKSEIELGKRLGSRLYVRYLIGLFDQTQKIAIEYKINDVLSLEAQTSPDDFGLDFIYEIERD